MSISDKTKSRLKLLRLLKKFGVAKSMLDMHLTMLELQEALSASYSMSSFGGGVIGIESLDIVLKAVTYKDPSV